MQVTIVFDGAALPAKRETELSRAKTREESLLKAHELVAQGASIQADALYAKSVDVTPEMAHKVALALVPLGVTVIVAPYEADAQLAYLSRNNLVDVVISEDSDLLVYQCARVLYKVDFKTERGQEVTYKSIFTCPGGFDRLSPETFLLASILSGCDYLPSLSSIGLRKAIGIAIKAEGLLAKQDLTIESDSFINRLLMLAKLTGVDEDAIGDDFAHRFREAVFTFRHQTVFCPVQRRLVPLTEYSPSTTTLANLDFLGEFYDDELAGLVADCRIHPDTKMQFTTVDASGEHQVRTVRKSHKRPVKIASAKTSEVQPTGMRTLAACWAYTVPSSIPATSTFVNPVIQLSDSDEEVAPVMKPVLRDVNVRVHVDDLDVFSAVPTAPLIGIGKRVRRNVSPTRPTVTTSIDLIENFSLDKYKN